MKTKNNTHDNIQKLNSRNNIRSKIAGLATLAFLAYAPNALALNAVQPEQQKKQVEVKEEPCNERRSLLMIAPFYTDKKNFGLDFTIEKRISKNIMLGIGGFFIPNAKQHITTNMQHDEYTVRGAKLLGETNLLTERQWEAYGLLLNAFYGNQCELMIGVEGGIGWQKNHFKHTLRQTVEEVDTKKLLDEYVCKAGGDDINKMIYRAGVGLVIPLIKNDLYLQLGGGVFGNLPKTTEVSFYNGNIKKTLDLGLETMGYAKLGIAFKF